MFIAEFPLFFKTRRWRFWSRVRRW